MAEYIDREKVLLSKFTVIKESEYAKGWNDALDAVAENAIAADVAPVVHARWSQEKSVTLNFEQRLDNCGTQYRCSKCGRRAGYKQVRLYLYCPHCGAKMDGTEANS